jgi:hypothetical protein
VLVATHKRILVVYYSLTGTTSKVAKDLAARLDADIERIEDTQHGVGFLNYLKASLHAWRQIPAVIGALQRDPAQYELTLVGTPVWCWQMTPAVRAYLQQTGSKPHKVAFFVTSGDTDIAKLAPSMEALANRKAVASAGFSARELNDSVTYNNKLAAFVQAIRNAIATNVGEPDHSH